MASSSIRFILLSIVLMALAVYGFAQGGATGAISGTVQDPSGAFVSGADVRITNQETGVTERTVKTDADGTFSAPLMPVGTYGVSVQSSSFAETKVSDVAVRVTETTRMTVKLTTQSVQQKIEVQAEVQTVDTSDATTGQAIESYYDPFAAARHAKLSAIADVIHGRAERSERGGATWARKRSYPGERPARR